MTHYIFYSFYYRDPKDYTDEPERARRSVVDVVITYPTNSIVDMNDIKGRFQQNSTLPTVTTPPTSVTEDPNRRVEKLQYKNAALFWGLIAVLILILLLILIIAFCFCCPGCYLYNKE